jgi:predicted CXXCH cytochrome family protein
MRRASRRRWLLAGVSAISVAAGAILLRTNRPSTETPSRKPVAPAGAAVAGDYVDPAVCGNCHTDIARTFGKTGMARSFYRLTPARIVEDYKTEKPFYHEASDSYFAMIERGGNYYQRRWQIGFEGKQTNIDEKQIDYVLGSGNHARTYLHRTGRNTLQQLPLGWYAEKGGYWAMNPGYDRPDYQGSTRAIHYECMFCHNGYPRVPAGYDEPGAEARYLDPIPEGIDCQRCHGPGRRHVQTVAKTGAAREEIRAAIVNPARLSADREMEICSQCHLETTSRLLPHSMQRLGRGAFSYVPGQPLEEFRLSFDRAPGKNQDFEVAHAAYRLRESQCFLKSAGKLRCTTCHNPHDIPRGAAAEAKYNAVCASCHTAIPQPAAVHGRGANCTGCHMPKRRTDDAVHIVMTDHKIVRRRPDGNLLAEKNEKHETPLTSYRGEVFAYYPEKPALTADVQLDLALAQVQDRSNLEAGILQLSGLIERLRPAAARYYAGLGEAYRASGDIAGAIAQFEEAVRREPESEILVLQLGNAFLESGQWVKAEAALRRARELNPGDAATSGLLGWALWQQDKAGEGKSSLESGLKLDPELADLHNYLGKLLMGTGDVTGAEREFRAALQINPGIAEWRLNLARLLAARNQIAEARYEAKSAAHADPSLAAAHELWGRLLSAQGEFAGAVRELEAAIRLKADSWLAHYELGVALGQLGNRSGAVEHLKMAARGTDPQVRAASLQVLGSIGQ